jgi:hypothetical protein
VPAGPRWPPRPQCKRYSAAASARCGRRRDCHRWTWFGATTGPRGVHKVIAGLMRPRVGNSSEALYAAKSRYGPGNRRDFPRLTPRGIRTGARETAFPQPPACRPDVGAGRPRPNSSVLCSSSVGTLARCFAKPSKPYLPRSATCSARVALSWPRTPCSANK